MKVRVTWCRRQAPLPSGERGLTDKPVFTTEPERQVARVMMEVIGKYEVKREQAPTSGAWLKAEVQKEIVAEVKERLRYCSHEIEDVRES